MIKYIHVGCISSYLIQNIELQDIFYMEAIHTVFSRPRGPHQCFAFCRSFSTNDF